MSRLERASWAVNNLLGSRVLQKRFGAGQKKKARKEQNKIAKTIVKNESRGWGTLWGIEDTSASVEF